MIATVGLSLIPFYVMRRLSFHYGDSIINNLRKRKYHTDYQRKKYEKQIEAISKATRTVYKFKRIYKDKEFKASNMADKRIKEMVDSYKSKKMTSFGSSSQNKQE